MAILKSERFFSWVNRWSGKDFGSSIGVLHEAFKIAHTYTSFWRKFLWIRDGFLHYGFWDFLHILCAYYAERKFCHKYTHALSPVWNRPHIRALYARKILPQIYMRSAVRLKSVGDWLSVGILAFVCITFCICGHRLDKVVFVDWLMSKFGCKSVMKSYKFIVKMWLCRCNCMCICVCIWYWLWFVVVLIRQSSGCSQIDEVRLV